MNTLQTQSKRQTMNRVYAVFFMKKLYGRIAVKTYIVLGLAYLEAKMVFVKQIFANMPSITDVPAVYSFYSYAFLNTRFIVQITIVAAMFTALWLARDLFRKENTFGIAE